MYHEQYVESVCESLREKKCYGNFRATWSIFDRNVPISIGNRPHSQISLKDMMIYGRNAFFSDICPKTFF